MWHIHFHRRGRRDLDHIPFEGGNSSLRVERVAEPAGQPQLPGCRTEQQRPLDSGASGARGSADAYHAVEPSTDATVACSVTDNPSILQWLQRNAEFLGIGGVTQPAELVARFSEANNGLAQAPVTISGVAKTLLVDVMSATTGECLFGYRLHPNEKVGYLIRRMGYLTFKHCPDEAGNGFNLVFSGRKLDPSQSILYTSHAGRQQCFTTSL